MRDNTNYERIAKNEAHKFRMGVRTMMHIDFKDKLNQYKMHTYTVPYYTEGAEVLIAVEYTPDIMVKNWSLEETDKDYANAESYYWIIHVTGFTVYDIKNDLNTIFNSLDNNEDTYKYNDDPTITLHWLRADGSLSGYY